MMNNDALNPTLEIVFASNRCGENVICVKSPRIGRCVGVTNQHELITMVKAPTRADIIRSVKIWHPVPSWMTPSEVADMHNLFAA
jgi:hypothetical protein